MDDWSKFQAKVEAKANSGPPLVWCRYQGYDWYYRTTVPINTNLTDYDQQMKKQNKETRYVPVTISDNTGFGRKMFLVYYRDLTLKID